MVAITKNNQLVVLGETNFRNQRWRFGIKPDDRRRHMYVVGSTGMGKSEFLKNMAIQDIEAGRGLAFIDPHGDSADELLDHIPAERIKDVVYLDPGDLSYPIAFNVMEKVDFEFRHLITSGLLGVFKKIFGVEAWSGRMEYILNNTILALLEYPDSTLLGINKMLSNKEYRKKVVDNIKDPIVKSFWVDEFAKYTERFAAEATPAIQNKIGQFVSNNLIRNIIGQVHSTIDVRRIMDEGKIFIVNISRGKIGEDASRLLGALLVTKIQLAAMSRVDIPESQRRDFYLYVDEFQHFATESFANILSEARKYHLSLIMAHQYIKQMEEPVMDAVFGNVGTIISFRVGAEDGEFLEKWFQPDFMMNDIVNLGKYNIYLKLMIDGVSSKGFSAQMMPLIPKLEKSNREAVVEYSRKTYATSREIVEKDIAEWAGMTFGVSEERQPSRNETGRGQGWQSRQEEYRGSPVPARRPMTNQAPQQFKNENYSPRREESRPRQFAPNFEKREELQQPRGQTSTRPQEWSNHQQPLSPLPSQQQRSQFQPRQQPLPQPQSQLPQTQSPMQPQAQKTPASAQTPTEFRIQQKSQMQLQPSGLSMNDAIRQGPINFHGRRIDERKERPKAEVNTDELKKALEEAMKVDN